MKLFTQGGQHSRRSGDRATSDTTIITDNSAPGYLTRPSTLRRAGTPTP
jgi:hypothetical protein